MSLPFVVGGDMGTVGHVFPLLTLAAAENPHFAIVGGDISYGNGELTNYMIWIKWLQNWDKHMVTADGYSIPFVAAIGNHEVRGKIIKHAPFFKDILHQSKKTYFKRDFGKLFRLIVLDTGHMTSYGGLQKRFLKKSLKKGMDFPYRFAAYHIPLYPSNRPYTLFSSVKGRFFWRKLFEKYNVHTGFEHHDHTLKRTHVLKDGTISRDGKGVVYIGDGCFGRERREAEQRWYLAKSIGIEHFWSLSVDNDGVHYKAVDSEGNVIDQYYREKQ